MRATPRFLLLPAVLLVLLVGCKSNPYDEGGPPAELRNTLRLYENVVRWGDLRRMYIFGEVPDSIPAGLVNVRVTRYEIGRGPLETDSGAWEQTVYLEYVLEDRQVVKQVLDLQRWESLDDGETWHRVTPHPDFR